MGESDLRGAGPVWRAISQRVTQGSLVLAALISVVVCSLAWLIGSLSCGLHAAPNNRMKFVSVDPYLPFPGPVGALTVYNAGLRLVRIGKDGDGGYPIADLGRDAYDVYVAGGVNDDTSFDRAFLGMHDIRHGYAFDGTIEQAPPLPPNLMWIKQNIGFGPTTNDLTEYLRKGKDVFLKMDIEGAEWDWLHKIDVSDLRRIKQIVMEIHDPGNESYGLTSDVKLQILAKLASEFVLVHAHGNNNSPFHNVKGVAVPQALELTYVRSGIGNAVVGQVPRRQSPLPDASLDQRNSYLFPELLITHPPFVMVPGEAALHAVM